MTIEHRGRQRTMVCDNCGHEFDPFDSDQFLTMLAEAKNDGWTVVREEGIWEHYCSSCKPGRETKVERARRMMGLSK